MASVCTAVVHSVAAIGCVTCESQPNSHLFSKWYSDAKIVVIEAELQLLLPVLRLDECIMCVDTGRYYNYVKWRS